MKFSTIIKHERAHNGRIVRVCDERNRRNEEDTGRFDMECNGCPLRWEIQKSISDHGYIPCSLFVLSDSDDFTQAVIGEILLNLEAQGD